MCSIFKILKKEILLFHPESPGVKVIVFRGVLKRFFYPTGFATLRETLHKINKED